MDLQRVIIADLQSHHDPSFELVTAPLRFILAMSTNDKF